VTILQRQKKKKKGLEEIELCVFHEHTGELEGKYSFEARAHRPRLYPSSLIHPEAVGWQHSWNPRSQEASTSIIAAEPPLRIISKYEQMLFQILLGLLNIFSNTNNVHS